MERQTPGDRQFKVIGTRPLRHDGEDKVTGRAQYGADVTFRDQLHGKVLRSPHAHARIASIDTSRAEALPGVQAVVTSKGMAHLEDKVVELGEGTENLRYMTDRVLARDKALFKGHAVAAVAATDPWTAEEACKLIDVQYEVLPPVTDVLGAMADDAPRLHPEMTTDSLGRKEKQGSNVVKHTRHQRGDVEAGFRAADVVIEREFRTKAVHQGYIEPHHSTALAHSDGQVEVWTCTQGAFAVRDQLATILQIPLSRIKVTPTEIGGGFGGKIPVYLEPLAVMLSQRTGRPVKMSMTRAEVFESTGPASGTFTRIKIGVKKDGTIAALQAWMAYDAGAFPTTWGAMGALCVFATYRTDHVLVDSFDVLTNTPKVAAYRAPSSPQAMFGVESVLDEIARELGLDPFELRMRNAAEEGTTRPDGLVYPRIGLKETIEAVRNSAHYTSPKPAGPNEGRGVALGFWANNGMQSSAQVAINLDGTASVTTGSVDIGGSRASMAIMAAEALGLQAEEVRPSVSDTEHIGHTDITAGSRTTFATGYAVYEAAQRAIEQMKARVAKLWDCPAEEVAFRDGAFVHTGGRHDAMTVRQLAPKLPATGGPVMGCCSMAAGKWGVGFGAHIADVRVDPETGKVDILRYTAAQDVGRAIHPAYVEGQLQGGAVQGIGWALNEEYILSERGEMLNAGFLDYRMPTMLDVPDIETILVEVPHPFHPYGVRGVGEVPIVPPLGAIHNAIFDAVGVRVRDLPMSPPKLQKAIAEAGVAAKPVATPA